MYIPMTMTPEEARAEIHSGNVSMEAVGKIEQILCGEKLTPLQSQAVLTTAWDWIIRQGRVSGWEK